VRIVYVAKHDSGGNDDEGAIHHALVTLGHDVQRLRECKGHFAHRLEGDMLLFHHWLDPIVLDRAKGKMRRVFWNFDLVDWPSDPSLIPRCLRRKEWMDTVMPRVELGFCTDGDWVQKHPEKLRWLTQGADQRYVGMGGQVQCGECGAPKDLPPILFTGIGQGGGKERESFARELRSGYGPLFNHVERKLHGDQLKRTISSSNIIVAPDSPITSMYWSNRVYITLGYGGFLLHPYAEGLAFQYKDVQHLVFYDTRTELLQLIDTYMDKSMLETRRYIARAGLEHTIKNHTYLQRCRELIATVEKELP
jgi:hypothetical protein